MKDKTFISLIVYIDNNVSRSAESLLSLDDFLYSKFENYEIIAVNDSNTESRMSEIRNIFDRLHRNMMIINLPWRYGPDNSILAGVDFAIGDFVIEIELGKMDYDVGLLHELFIESNKGFDIVSATRSKGMSLGNRIFFKLFNKISYLPFEVYDESVRLVSRRAINSILNMNERIIYRGILYKYSGFPSNTIKYEPLQGLSHIRRTNFKDKLKIALDTIVSYSNIGTNLSIFFALVFLLLSITLGIYALIIFFTLEGVIPGWTTTMLFMSASFSGVFIILGLQGRYISSIIYEIKRRPKYTVRSIERSSGKRDQI